MAIERGQMQLRLVGDDEQKPAEFEEFWQLYPRKIEKRSALLAWSLLSASERIAAVQALPSHIQQWRQEDPKFIVYAERWLKRRRWEDQLEVCLDVNPCRWTGCKRSGTQQRGQGWYCEGHIASLNRGETPSR